MFPVAASKEILLHNSSSLRIRALLAGAAIAAAGLCAALAQTSVAMKTASQASEGMQRAMQNDRGQLVPSEFRVNYATDRRTAEHPTTLVTQVSAPGARYAAAQRQGTIYRRLARPEQMEYG